MPEIRHHNCPLKRRPGEIERLNAQGDCPHGVYRMLREAGLANVQDRPFLAGFRSSDPMVEPATMESVRSALFAKGFIANELDGLISECLARLAEPDTVSTFHTVLPVWGIRRET
jgi:hypothetical protein